ncbi:cytochrome P450 [Lentinus brumalis]|uniref:Cytochrome P450 n=1 Tax=Lentinus brumalis TaxID=2498619 RepID=A0A371D6E2_9APHY|nr:cytochrome P450 [Polyporus brumalis]
MHWSSAHVALAFTVVLLLIALIRRVVRRSIKHIRGPASRSWLSGHERELVFQDEVGTLESHWLHEYGSTWRIGGYFATDILMTADPKAMQHIYQKYPYSYAKRASQVHIVYLLTGPGILSTSAQGHVRHRKIMNPSFSASRLRSFLPIFQRIGGKLSELLKANVDVRSGELDVMFNKWISGATLDIIGEAAFNYDYGALDHSGSPLYKAYDNLLKDAEYHPTDAALLFKATWNYTPESILKLFRYIPAHPMTLLRRVNSLYVAYGKQILQSERSGADTEKQPSSKDIMSAFIKANRSADPKARLDDSELMAQMFTLTFAGHETTATTLTFLFYELSRHPEYQERMREEIGTVRAEVSTRGDQEFSMEDLDSMKLTMNAIKETLRFHPIVPHLPRVATADDVLPLEFPIVSRGGEVLTEIPIRAGQVIFTSFAMYNRLSQLWGDDADVWNPDRFTRHDLGKQANVGMFANLMTFSAGARGCIGWRFTVIEMQSLVAELVENFRFAPPSEDVVIQRSPAGPVMTPTLRGKEDVGTAMPLRISLAR